MRKIAVVGANRRTKLLAPYDDPSWEIWSCSLRNESELPRHDAWFEIHTPYVVETFSGEVFLEWLRRQPKVYMQAVTAKYPGSIAYPKNEMVARFGSEFFTSTITWMLALAISRSPRTIGLWGVECSTASEYGPERYGVLHFLELARALGVGVILPGGCALSKPSKLYGYDDDRGSSSGVAA